MEVPDPRQVYTKNELFNAVHDRFSLNYLLIQFIDITDYFLRLT